MSVLTTPSPNKKLHNAKCTRVIEVLGVLLDKVSASDNTTYVCIQLDSLQHQAVQDYKIAGAAWYHYHRSVRVRAIEDTRELVMSQLAHGGGSYKSCIERSYALDPPHMHRMFGRGYSPQLEVTHKALCKQQRVMWIQHMIALVQYRMNNPLPFLTPNAAVNSVNKEGA
jgi:hypothetical protein